MCEGPQNARHSPTPSPFLGKLAPGSTLPQSLSLIREDNNPVCLAAKRTRLYWQNSGGLSPLSAPGSSQPCLDECIATSNSPACTTATSDSRNYSLSTYNTIACYCSQRLLQSVASQGIVTGASTLLKVDGSLCNSVGQDYLTYHAFTIVASVIVTIMCVECYRGGGFTLLGPMSCSSCYSNVALRFGLERLAAFEGQHTVSQFQKGLAFKVRSSSTMDRLDVQMVLLSAQLFLVLFLNTACIVLLINAALPSTVSDLNVNGQRVLVGQYSGFDVSWHVSVGAGLVFTMVRVAPPTLTTTALPADRL